MAGFEVITYGRFWVTAEAKSMAVCFGLRVSLSLKRNKPGRFVYAQVDSWYELRRNCRRDSVWSTAQFDDEPAGRFPLSTRGCHGSG